MPEFHSRIVLTSFWVLLAFGCRDSLVDPYSPEAIAGSYRIDEFTDKRSSMRFPSGVPVEIGGGLTSSHSGSLNLTQTKFSLSRTWTTFDHGALREKSTETVVGDYSVDEALFKIREDSSGRVDSIPIMVRAGGLVLEDNEFKFVFVRQ